MLVQELNVGNHWSPNKEALILAVDAHDGHFIQDPTMRKPCYS